MVSKDWLDGCSQGKGLNEQSTVLWRKAEKYELTSNLNNFIFSFAERPTLRKKSDSSACLSSVLQHMADSEDPL